MDIVIITEFCDDFSRTDNDRFFYLARMLVNESSDNQVEIITSSFRHTTKKHRREVAEKWPIKITFIEEPGYPKNICLKRFQSHYVWGKNVAKYLAKRNKPDVIFCAVPSLTGPNLAAKYCEKEHIRFVVDVQDLWPEAFQLILNVPVMSRIVFSPFMALANGIYKRADAVCAVSETYARRAASVNHKIQNTAVVYLGTELETFDKYAAGIPILKKDKNEIWLAYCGTLGSSYDLTCVMDALHLLDNPRLRFVVMGDGPNADTFRAYAEQMKVKADFTGRLSYDKMCCLLSACDITVNPIMHNAAQSIINKHADYAASGKPVISTQESPEYRKLIDEYRMGFNCKNNDPADLAEKLKRLIDSDQLRIEMGNNARKCAEERFDRKTTYRQLIKTIQQEN